jgi:hypothetical protein
MERHSRYAILLEAVPIGPVTAPNRFCQVPRCSGAGDATPAAVASPRDMKAERGWGIVCAENTEISRLTEIPPFAALHLRARLAGRRSRGGRDIKDIPDLRNVNIADSRQDSANSRSAKEGFRAPYTRFLRQVIGKPAVGDRVHSSTCLPAANVRRVRPAAHDRRRR